MTERRGYSRPVPTVGDTTSAAHRAADPAGWAMPVSVRDALQEVVAARRDVRRFRPDPVPGEVLRRVLEAAHAAPSVGHSQPWRFVIATDPKTRDTAALLADRERIRQASAMPEDRRRRLLDLQLEGIREAPLGVVVACDRRAEARGVLGRATFPDADMWSAACAVQNLWLAARAEGLGVGWVTFFQPADLADLLHLPEGVETLGWLCLGWPDERPPEPGLQRAGWSQRLALDDVILSERWPHDDVAPPEQHVAVPGLSPLDIVAARDAADRLLTAPGSLGLLDRAVERLLAVMPDQAQTFGGTLIVVAGTHPVAELGVSGYPSSVCTDVLAATVSGQSLGATAATAAGLVVLAIDARGSGQTIAGAVRLNVPGARGDLRSSDALDLSTTLALIAHGRSVGEAAAADGLVALGEVGIGNTTVGAALAAALLGLDADQVVGLGAGADSSILQRKRDVVATALARVAPRRTDAVGLLAALGGPEVAVLVGVVLGAAAAGACIVLDGLVTCVAAAVAIRCEPAAAHYLIAGHRSREVAHALVLADLGLEPLLDLRLRAGEGVGACLAANLLRQALVMRRDTAVVTDVLSGETSVSGS